MHIILAPCNLGLRPLHPGHIPGTWRAPQVLMDHGLATRLQADAIIELLRPDYSADKQPGTRLLNGSAIRDFCLRLATEVAEVQAQNKFPLVIGGDCSILLGALVGSRSAGPVSLIHIDGHSDFRHPGNYDPNKTLGAVAGMDLALITGRGEPLLTTWPGVTGPLVNEQQILQLGERESRDADFAWPDVAQTEITCIDVFAANLMGPAQIAHQIALTLNTRSGQRFWIHFDVDVLDRTVMPAVDSPGTPGLEQLWLENICAGLLQNPLCCGMTVTVFDPDLDSEGRGAALIVQMLDTMFTAA